MLVRNKREIWGANGIGFTFQQKTSFSTKYETKLVLLNKWTKYCGNIGRHSPMPPTSG